MAAEEPHISHSKPAFLRYLKIPIKMMSFWLLADREADTYIMQHLSIHGVAVYKEPECMLMPLVKTREEVLFLRVIMPTVRSLVKGWTVHHTNTLIAEVQKVMAVVEEDS